MRRALALTLGVGLTLATAAAGRAQDRDLDGSLDVLADLWSRSDAAGIAGFATAAGVSLELDGDEVGPLARRQVAAALKHLFGMRETVAVAPSMAAPVAGEPDRAYAELAWLVHVRGTTIPDTSMVFLALSREADGWRVSQIRILP